VQSASRSLASELDDLRGAVEAQTAGLMKMLAILAQQSAMLKEILSACATPEPDAPSPLVNLILKLHGAIEDQSAAIARVEAAIAPPAR
jgi:hypothetical protein